MKHLALGMLALAASVLPVLAQGASEASTDDQIRQILKDRIDVQHQGVGIVVGIVDARGRRIVAYGHPDTNDSRPVDGTSIFEIGSVTKVFTSAVLANMVERGEVSLDDPVVKFLPKGTQIPQRNGKQITLGDLATQTSGLPRLPDKFSSGKSRQPVCGLLCRAVV